MDEYTEVVRRLRDLAARYRHSQQQAEDAAAEASAAAAKYRNLADAAEAAAEDLVYLATGTGEQRYPL